jgi:hypothetical protein
MGLGPMSPHLWLKDEIARELLEEAAEDRRGERRRRLPDGRRESSDPSFLTDGDTDHEVLTGEASRE